MKRQKRYTAEKQILDEIDLVKAKQLEERVSANKLDGEADDLFEWCARNPPFSNKAFEHWNGQKFVAKLKREEAAKLRKHQATLTNKLETLKRTLAAFRTAPMPFVDESVVLQ